MSFAVPAALWLLALLPLLVLFHLRRRRSVEVGSVIIWRRLGDGAQQARPRIARPPSALALLLQILGVSALALAIARPTVAGESLNHHLFILDASLPMHARDVEPSRFERAVADVSEQLASTSRHDRVSLLALAGAGEVVAAGLSPLAALERFEAWSTAALATPSAMRADWLEAALLAQQMQGGFGAASLRLWTSPQDAETALAAFAGAGLEVAALHQVGQAAGFFNAGFREVTLLRRGGEGRWTVQGSIISTGLSNRTLSVRAVFAPFNLDGDLVWGTTEVTTDRFGVATFSLPLDLPSEGVLELQLLGSDHLALDDRMAVVAAPRPEPQVLLLGPANAPLERALLSLPGVAVFRSDTLPGDASGYDLVIVDRVSLERSPATSTLYLSGALPVAAPALPLEPITLRPDAWLRDHPLLRGIDWGGLELELVERFEPTTFGWEVLVSAERTALMSARTTEFGREVVLGVNSYDAPWLATAAFPALIAAVLDWALPDSDLGEPRSCRIAQACGLPRSAFAPDWRLFDGDGAVVASPSAWLTAPDGLRVWAAGAFDASFVPTQSGRFSLQHAMGEAPVLVWPTALVEPGSRIELEGAAMAASANVGGATQWWVLLAWVTVAALLLDLLVALLRNERWLPRRWRSAEPRRRFVAVNLLTAGSLLTLLFALAAVPTLQQRSLYHQVLIRDAAAAANSAVEVPAEVIRLELSSLGVASEPGVVPVLDAQRALQLLNASAPGSLPIRVALELSDATTLAELSHLLALEPAQLDWVAHLPSPEAEPLLAVTTLEVPDAWPAGNQAELSLSVENRSSEARRLLVDFAGVEIEVGVVPPGGASLTFTLRAPLEPGAFPLRVGVVDPQRGQFDVLAERRVEVGAAPAALLITLDVQGAAPFAEQLRAQGLRVDTNIPRRFPSTLEALGAYQVVVLADVPAVALHTFHQDLLAEWVSSRGGGALFLGGASAFGAGGYLLTPLDAISPLSSKIPDEAPEVTMVFVLDRSGSMSARVGEGTRLQVAQEATAAALKLLNPDSLVGLVAFDAEAEAIVPMVRAVDIDRLVAAVDRLRPGGGTDVFVGLLEAERLLLEVDSSVLHVVVMTDGITQVGDFAGVLGRLRAMGATTSFIGIGDGADQGQLRRLADMGGGNLHFTRDFRALPAIMALETSMAASDAVEWNSVQPSWLEPIPPFADGRPRSAPLLDAYVRTTLKPEANLHLLDAALDVPLLASWRYGAGRVVAFSSDPIGAWAPAWEGDPTLLDLWSELLRWSASPVVRAGIELETWYEGPLLRVRASMRNEEAAPVVDLRPTVTLLDAALDEVLVELQLHEVRPGVYQGGVRVPELFGSLQLRVSAGEGAPFFLREQVRTLEGPTQAPSRQPRLLVGLEWDERLIPNVDVEGLQAALRPELRWRWGGDGAGWLAIALVLWMLALANRYAALGRLRWR